MKGELGENSQIKRLNCRRDSQWFCEIVPCSVHFRRFLSNINKFRSTAMLLCDSSDEDNLTRK